MKQTATGQGWRGKGMKQMLVQRWDSWEFPLEVTGVSKGSEVQKKLRHDCLHSSQHFQYQCGQGIDTNQKKAREAGLVRKIERSHLGKSRPGLSNRSRM